MRICWILPDMPNGAARTADIWGVRVNLKIFPCRVEFQVGSKSSTGIQIKGFGIQVVEIVEPDAR